MNFYEVLRYLSRCYLDLQHLRVAVQLRLKNLPEDAPEDVKKIMEQFFNVLYNEEKNLLKNTEKLLKEHPLWQWCNRVKGLGRVACLTFLGFINPFVADTAGKAKSYIGCVPGKKIKSGERLKVNLEAKGRIWLITRNVIMAKDPFYYKLYQQKKQYYMNTSRKVFLADKGEWVTYPPFKKIIEDPKKCPRYDECLKKLQGKAQRLGRPMKNPPCKAHVDAMAKRWLMGILVSHATELMRRHEGLDVTAFKAHKNYIPPP